MERLKGNDLMSTGAQFTESTSSNNLNTWISTFNTNEGHAQPNRYEIAIFPPFKSEDNRAIQLRCESVILPGRNLSSTPDSNIHGPLREVVNNVNYVDSVAMVFQASADLRERVFFEKWQYTAFNQETWNVGYYNDYIGEVDIYLLDKNNQRKYGLKLMECFPKEIGPSDLSYAANSEIIKLPITMNFRYWTTLDTTQTSKGTVLAGATVEGHVTKIINALPAVETKLSPEAEAWPRTIEVGDHSRRAIDPNGRQPSWVIARRLRKAGHDAAMIAAIRRTGLGMRHL
jgi:hypothetical protein